MTPDADAPEQTNKIPAETSAATAATESPSSTAPPADAGRVYVDGATPGGWHTGVGGGIYFKPIAQPYMLRAGAGFSDDGTKIYVVLGLPY